MGAIVDVDEDAAAVEMLRQMPVEAKLWLNHHIGNPLLNLLNAGSLNNPDMTERAARHIVEDMKRIGCFTLVSFPARRWETIKQLLFRFCCIRAFPRGGGRREARHNG